MSVPPHSAFCFGTIAAQQLLFFFFFDDADTGIQCGRTAERRAARQGGCMSHRPARTETKGQGGRRGQIEGGADGQPQQKTMELLIGISNISFWGQWAEYLL